MKLYILSERWQNRAKFDFFIEENLSGINKFITLCDNLHGFIVNMQAKYTFQLHIFKVFFYSG